MAKITKLERKVQTPPRRKRVCAYARVSKESERLMHSVSAQVSYYSELIQSNPEWEYAGVYADFGISGTGIKERDEFQRLIEDCEAGKIDIVLTKSISRFARNTVDLLATVRHLKEIGVEVRFEKEHINSFSGDGEVMLSILASFAQEESCSISENVKWGIRKGFEKGKQNGNRRIYGYKWNGEKYVIVPEEARFVELMFKNYVCGVPLQETVKQLKEMGARTVRGYEFTGTQITYILQNERYCGDKLLQKRFVESYITHKEKINDGELPRYYVKDCHDAIVDRKIFMQVQEEIKRRRSIGHAAQPGIKTYCFTGKLICGNCGQAFTRAMNRYKVMPPYVYWTCGTKKKKGEHCSSKNIPDESLKNCIAELLGTEQFDEQMFLRKIEKIVVKEPRDVLVYFYDGRKEQRTIQMKGYKHPYSPEVKAYREEQRKLKKEAMRDGKNNNDSGNDR